MNAQPLGEQFTCLGDGHEGVWNIVSEMGTSQQRMEVLEVGVESEVAFTPSHTKPCVRLSPHTAPNLIAPLLRIQCEAFRHEIELQCSK
ncbi:hypothetical protein B9R42_19395 [Arthrospira platensis PCC 7345]|nr:hypothetical protein AP285_10340 [Arthrospira platensis YZ]